MWLSMTHTHTHTHTHKCKHKLSLSVTDTHTHTHTHTHPYTHTQTNNTHTNTHTHSQLPPAVYKQFWDITHTRTPGPLSDRPWPSTAPLLPRSAHGSVSPQSHGARKRHKRIAAKPNP